MRLSISIFIFLIPFYLFGQNVTIIHNQQNQSIKTKTIFFKNHIAVIFPKEYHTNFNREYLKNRYTPDSLSIVIVEQKLKEQFVESSKRYLEAELKTIKNNREVYDSIDFEKYWTKRENSTIKAAKKKLRRIDEYYRQYLGLINSKNERIILINLVNINNSIKNDPYELKNVFDKEWISGFGDWFERNTQTFEYVIDRDKLYSFGWTER